MATGQLVGEGFHAVQRGNPMGRRWPCNRREHGPGGGSLYVTLEPCCHHGRTPPCTEAVLGAGIRRVVVAMVDPDPRVAGGGLERLRQAGLTVVQGVGEARARALNRGLSPPGGPWASLGCAQVGRQCGRAHCHPKQGTVSGSAAYAARRWVHRLRGRCDAVLVGAGTVRSDNPLLTSRGQRQPEPLRVVLSRRLHLPRQAKLWDQTVGRHRGVPQPWRRSRCSSPTGTTRCGTCIALEPCSPRTVLEHLARRGCNKVLWECGPALAAAAVQEGCVQEIAAVQAPKLLGGVEAFTPLGDLRDRHHGPEPAPAPIPVWNAVVTT